MREQCWILGEGLDIRRRPPTVPATLPPMALAFTLSRGVRRSSPPQTRTAMLRETVDSRQRMSSALGRGHY